MSTNGHRRLAQMAGLETGWQDHAAEFGAWGAAITAWVVTFASEITLAERHQFGGLSVVWAIGLDWLAFGGMFLALSYARRGLRTWRVWAVSLGAWGTMIAANVAVALPDIAGAAMHGIIPLLAFALWHALVHGRKPRGAPVDLGAVWGRVLGRSEPPAPAQDRLPVQARQALAKPQPVGYEHQPIGPRQREAVAAVKAEVAAGRTLEELTGPWLMGVLGLNTESRARALLSQAKAAIRAEHRNGSTPQEATR